MRSKPDARTPQRSDAADEPSRHGVALGFLAMLPMIVSYELAREVRPSAGRNVAELFLATPLELVTGSRAVHWSAIAACAAIALATVYRRELGLVSRLWRVFVEGVVAAIAMGPILVMGLAFVGPSMAAGTLAASDPASPGGAVSAAVLAGGAAYEELVFRVGVLSLFVLAFSRIARAFAAPGRVSRAIAVACAVCVSSLVFAAAHLEVVTRSLGPGGETFDAATFTWRTFAGVLLASLFLWRGPGVAAWSHGLFNLALYIGVGPEVFL